MQFTESIVSLTAFVAAAAAITGRATFFDPNGLAGECGFSIQNTDFAVALSPANYNGGAFCGQDIVVESHPPHADPARLEHAPHLRFQSAACALALPLLRAHHPRMGPLPYGRFQSTDQEITYKDK
ncbi:hypothetical protein DFH07DRAFT_955532 [Mycena maculata]|uniref:SSCRP protein n=1 Tax=Mycena maculata TaxID=230809 RepID=A0AAD7JJ23_9AGAR|nr:hypothetical protein DFH07DRAFT_955532 [Mycena maculata]